MWRSLTFLYISFLFCLTFDKNAERHAGHHGVIRRCQGISCHPHPGRSGNWRSDSEGKAERGRVFFFFFFSMAVTGWGNCSDHMFFSRWAIAEEACRCVRSTACSPTRTPQLLGPASTGPVLLLWSVFLMCDQRCVTYSDECEPALLQTDPNTSWCCQNLKGTVHSQIIFNKDTYFSSDL